MVVTKIELGNGAHGILAFTPSNYDIEVPQNVIKADMKLTLIMCEPFEGASGRSRVTSLL